MFISRAILFVYFFSGFYESDAGDESESDMDQNTTHGLFDGYHKEQLPNPSKSFQHEQMLSQKNLGPTVRCIGQRFLGVILLQDDGINKLWLPDLFFRNEKDASYHFVTVPNRLIRIYNDGTIFYVVKITLNLACPMRLEAYPMDSQSCPVIIESFSNTADKLKLGWLAEPITYSREVTLPQFILEKHDLIDCSQTYVTGVFPCVQVNFRLQRNLGYYIIQLYVPSVLIVILSWVGFWISMEAVPARVTIGLLTVLTITTQRSSVGQSLPRVSYIKAVDTWFAVCLIFVFSSLIEFSIVNVISRTDYRREKKRRRKINRLAGMIGVGQGLKLKRSSVIKKPAATNFIQDNNDESLARVVSENGHHKESSGDEEIRKYAEPPGKKRTSKDTANMADEISRIAFPVTFVLFNLIYWFSYLVILK